MAAPAPAAGGPPPAASAPGGAKGDTPARPLGPDGKPIPGPAEVRQIQAARKMAQQQAQVDEVIGIMHTNVENVLERDRKLGDLEERADALQDGCAQFEKQAAAMKNKFWLENLKSIIAGAVIGLIVLGLIYYNFFMKDQNPYGPPPPGGYYQQQPQVVQTQQQQVPDVPADSDADTETESTSGGN